MPYEELPHTADLRIRVYAESLPELFSESVFALYHIIFGNYSSCKGTKKDSFSLTATDIDILLHDFLDEILYLTLVMQRKICEFSMKIDENELNIFFDYSYKDLDYNEVKKEVKAITYHNLHIRKIGNFYETEVVMDV